MQHAVQRTRRLPNDARRRGVALKAAGNLRGALAAFIEASRRTPRDAGVQAAICSLLSDIGDHTSAIGAGLLAVALDPRSAHAQAELGRAFFLADELEAALEPCARAVVLAPRNLGAITTFGAVLSHLGRHEQALSTAQEAVTLAPGHVQARVNLSLALEALGRLDEAEAHSRRALALEPDSPTMRHNLAALRLSRGKLDAESWQLYEARLELTDAARRLGAVPRWSGEDLGGRTILVHAEQGFGDVIQFARHLRQLKPRGAGRVILAVPPPLLRLLADVDGVDLVVPTATAFPPHDAFCPIASLPGVLGTTIEDIPAPIPYIRARPEAASLQPGPGLNVGLAWAGNPGFVHDRLRSLDPGLLAPLQDMPGVTFHSLQKGGRPPFPMRDQMPEMADFADTAGLLAGMDLVIAVDTAVAHLAGAMGRPVWLLSRYMGCWRWLRDRDDSPWYPTIRIFRQRHSGDWRGVIDDVRTALRERVSAAPGPAR